MTQLRLDQHWPEEIISDILARVEPKPLARFKVVNKEWYRIISSKTFMIQNLHFMKELNYTVYIFQPDYCFSALFYNAENQYLSNNGRQISEDDKQYELLAAANGLVAFCEVEDNFWLWNPTTGAMSSVPTCLIDFPVGSYWAQVFFGMSFDYESSDYKFVRIALFNSFDFDTEVAVFSKNSGTWSRLPNFPVEFPIAQPGVLVCGRLHWRTFIFFNQYSITTLCVKSGMYSSIAIPAVPVLFGVQDIVALDDVTLAISCVVLQPGSPYTLWILVDYYDETSWYKLVINIQDHIPYVSSLTSLQPLKFVKPGRREILFRVDPLGSYGIYDIATAIFTPIESDVEDDGYMSIFCFQPSLHSPEKAAILNIEDVSCSTLDSA